MRTEADYPLLSVEEAERRVLDAVAPLSPVAIPILEALDQVLAEDISAPFDVPPHANSAMDGYAVRDRDLAPGCELPVVGYLAAGHAWGQSLAEGTALRIMTGAPLPAGADTVVRFEDTTPLDNLVRIAVVPKQGRNVRLAGEDVRAGQLVLPAGRLLRPQEIGMLASLGRAKVRVHRRPVVAILSTGDEVAPRGRAAAAGRIRNINSYTNAAQVLAPAGSHCCSASPATGKTPLSARLQTALAQGRSDRHLRRRLGRRFRPGQARADAEGQMDFWWVNMKPGKPLAFGRLGGRAAAGAAGQSGGGHAGLSPLWAAGGAQDARTDLLGRADCARPRWRDAMERKDGRRHYLRVRLQPDGDGWIADSPATRARAS